MLGLPAPGHTAVGCRPSWAGASPTLNREATQAVGAGPSFLPLPSDPSLKLKPALLLQVSSRWRSRDPEEALPGDPGLLLADPGLGAMSRTGCHMCPTNGCHREVGAGWSPPPSGLVWRDPTGYIVHSVWQMLNKVLCVETCSEWMTGHSLSSGGMGICKETITGPVAGGRQNTLGGSITSLSGPPSAPSPEFRGLHIW